MWSYYGSKANMVEHYPKPRFDSIIEPFAGTARYSLKYFDRNVTILDKYEVVVNIWKWLQKCSPADIRRLPHFLKPGQSIDEFSFECHEARDLIGFLVGFGMAEPRRTATVKRTTKRPNNVNFSLNRIEKNLWKIRHWTILHGDYTDISNQKATWFIDPPYQHGGHSYVHSNKKINYQALATWCKARDGQVIVCENDYADWLNFKSMIVSHQGSKGRQKEVIWCNDKTVFDNQQLHLFKNI